MKKLMTIVLCTTCISVNIIAQSGVRIGNYELFLKKVETDSIEQIVLSEPCPPCPSENETRPKPKFTPYQQSDFFYGVGLIVPDNGDDYYTALGGKSINIDAGWMRRYHFSRRFALGGTLHYSYYNYKFRDAASEPFFNNVVLKNNTFVNDDIRKQTYRSHNIAASAFTRFYFIPPRNRGSDGLYIDLGAQGDFAFSRFAMLKTHSEGKKKHYEEYAFNPFNASAVARIGWKQPRRSVGKVYFGGGNSRALFVRYRFTDAFNTRSLPMDLPPITIGVQFF